MPIFSEYFRLNASQAELDFVNISTDFDIPVYVDPYAIEIRNDTWSNDVSESIRAFFKEVLNALTNSDDAKAIRLMDHLNEPSETFLGVSVGKPKGKGVGTQQALNLIDAIKRSKALSTGLLNDLSEMALYIDGVGRDKISDLTTNLIRKQLIEYTQQQCRLYNIQIKPYVGPPLWIREELNWQNRDVCLPHIEGQAILLIPKYIVRRTLSLESDPFYKKQITEFHQAEYLKAGGSLVTVLKDKSRKVYKKDVREKHPKSKAYIAEMVSDYPELLEFYKKLANKIQLLVNFTDDDPSISQVCRELASKLKSTPTGAKHSDLYHEITMGVLTTCFYPKLTLPSKEWEINSGRKRIDIVYNNSADSGFFSHRRDDSKTGANMIIVECKNYSTDIANQEIDQLLGRFDYNRGRLGFITCRSVDNPKLLLDRCKDLAKSTVAYIITLTDKDLLYLLDAKAKMDEESIESFLQSRFRNLIS